MDSPSNRSRVLVLDTETTGLSGAARIVEIAAIEVAPRTGPVGPHLHHVVDPQVPIPAAVTRIHGIGDADVRGKPAFGSVAPGVAAYLRGATIAIQNARFDCRILDAELARAKQPTLRDLDVRVVDTLDIARGVLPLLDGHSLDRVCDRVGVDRSARTLHGALLDADLLARTLPKLAAEYDAWRLAPDDGCSVELAAFERTLAAVVADAEMPAVATPEEADRAVGRAAAALKLLRVCESVLSGRAEALIDGAGWCCKHYAARWVSSTTTAWKEAALAYLSPAELEGYRRESAPVVLTAAGDDAFLRRHGGLASMLDEQPVASSIACAVRGLVAVRDATAALEERRAELRALLLEGERAGYAPRNARIDRRPRATTDHRRALSDLAPKADLTPYTDRTERLSIRRRDVSACRALFG
jgi:DNA polymerase-3 subunit epsilon